ncbi:amino acid adenylation domain-containing protein [Pseudomonas xanthosomatis]|uniref:amino acid adenylation domain-containing protein n=1 Tax=Pseudomonas xanthosomatis TaxID=2842356 RepID=UPI0035164AE9
MNAQDALKLARRYLDLPLEKRQLFLQALEREGIDFAQLPIAASQSPAALQVLSYAQKRMWVLWRLDPQGAAYNLPGAVRLRGALDRSALEQAFADLVARHATLRTVFVDQGQGEVGLTEAREALRIEHQDLQALAADAREAQVQASAREQVFAPFDLGQGPLLRVQVLRLEAEHHVLLLTLHHIVSDGWSMNVLIDEFSRCYAARAAGRTPELAALPVQYADYALWQRSWLEAGEQARQLQWWRDTLGASQPTLELPLDHPRPALPSYRGQRHELSLPAPLVERLRQFTRAQQLTPFMVLLGAFAVLLQRYSGQPDVRIGTPIANRNRNEVEGLIGCFVNTQVLRVQVDPQQSVHALLAAVKAMALGAQAHQELPFEQLVEALDLPRGGGHTPLFQVMYNHQPQVADISEVSVGDGLTLQAMQPASRTTQFDLTLDTYEQGGQLRAALTYASDLFEAASIERMGQHWTALLQAMLADPQQAVGNLSMLEQQELQVLEQWNHTFTEYDLALQVHQRFEQQVLRQPEAPALKFADQQLSYAELNRRANQLAHLLIARGVGPDVLVGVAAERSPEMVVALLAILKAGGAYVPLDPEYPRERLAYMLDDSGVQLLLTQRRLLAGLPAEGVQCLLLDELALDGQPAHNPQVAVDGEGLAYVIYTSGSTGKPKGAGNRHTALVNRLCWMQQAYRLTPADTVLQKTPFSFDVSVWEFFWPLIEGARLVLAAPGEHRDPARLVALIEAEQVSTLHFVPSMLQAFLQDPGVARCTSLRRIVCSGEALPVDAQQQVLARLPWAGLYNLYGPTEAAIDVTHWTCVDEGRDSVPIGRPIANLACHVLDASLEPVPAGVLGELYLAGEGLARGYHRRPGLTAERFVASPFVAGERMYRTGDLARYRADGVIEYAGRLDHQVKLRGLRIELGEIEARLLEHEWVREAVVLAEDGKRLLGYVVLTQAHAGWQQVLAAHLGGQLPEYMVPSQWLALESMPLSPNGKLERRALPQMQAAAQADYVAPQGELEQALAQIWAQVLQVAQVGREDNFFELGGDSIIAIQLANRARQAGIAFSPRELFQHQTVHSLALAASVADDAAPADTQLAEGELPLTPVQQLFFELPAFERSHWNQSLLLAPRQALRADWLAEALGWLCRQHDALRLGFTEQHGEWRQAYLAPSDETLLWQRELASADALPTACEEAQRSLSLAGGPLLRALLATLPDGSQRLLLAIHHLAVDGVSWRILLEDLQQAYARLQAGQPLLALAKSSSYQAWARRLQGHAGTLHGQVAWWQAQLDGVKPCLPQDRPVAEALNRDARKLQLSFAPELTRRLLQEAPAAYRTQVNDLLLTALARVIGRWSGQQQVLLELEGHGREPLFDDLDLGRTVGWFTSLFPLALKVEDDLAASLKAVKQQLRAVPDKGVGFGILRYLGEAPVRQAMAALPRPRITFNYLGRFDAQFDEQAAFVPAFEASGAAQDPAAPLGNWLTVEGQVHDGCLSLQWGYSAQMFDDATVQGLLDAYRDELQALVEHCCDPRHGGLTPADFPLAGLTQAQLDGLPGDPRQLQDLYPLSPMQQGMLFHSLYQQGSGDYINQLRLDLEGVDPQRLHDAWQHTVDAHDMLRSACLWHLERPLQQVMRHASVPWTLHDLQGAEDAQAQLEQLASAARSRGFALDHAPLLDLQLVQLAAGRHQLIYTHHHLLLDGWSNARVLVEVLQRYQGQAVPRPLGQYRDYIAWLGRQDSAASEAFWRRQLAMLDEPTRLARSLHPLPAADVTGQGEHHQQLDATATAALQAFAREQRVTLNTLVQAAWALLLQRYTGQACVAFGATVAGRPAGLPGIEEQVGLFINTLPVISRPAGDMHLGQWLRELQADNLRLREHEHTPLFDIQRWAGFGDALFDSLLVFENYPIDQALAQATPAGLRITSAGNQEQTSLPLTLSVTAGDTLDLHYRYSRAGFSAQGMALLAGHLRQLLWQLPARGAETPLGELLMLEADALALQVHRWNAPVHFADAPATVHGLFEQQVARTPDALALVHEHEQWTYAQLDAQANRLAHALIRRGLAPEQRVAIGMARSPQMLVAMLAVLKAGGAYVPLDLDYPAERLAHMLDDSQAVWVLGDGQGTVAMAGERLLSVPALLAGTDLPGHSPALAVAPGRLAYVIYTSGSTGRPKGVAISHGNVQALVQWSRGVYSQQDLQGVLASTSICFDLSVWEFFVTLACGGYCILARNALALAELPARQQVRLINSVPSAVTALLEAGHVPDSVRIVNMAGEPLKQALVEALYQRPGLVRVHDLYGPSEDTTYSTHAPRTAGGLACIGRPLENTAAYVLDAHAQVLPAGLAGELYLAGAGLSRGYLARPGLTAERYLPDPFAGNGQRMYRTGDLVRQGAQGELYYAGRLDHQVKVRGYRIELGELEARLLQLPGVRAAVVVAQPLQGGLQLVAYLEGQAGDAASVQAALRQSLPDYMVPAHVLNLAQLPLTPNGKVDRKALPLPGLLDDGAAHMAPVTPLQRAVAGIWEQVLECPQVGLNDRFFALGGHSLLATRVISQVRRELGIDAPLRLLFEQEHLEAFCAALAVLDVTGQRAIGQVSREQPLALSYAQERQWFLWQLEPQGSAYNLPVALRLGGQLDVAALAEAFNGLIARHESLRTRIEVVDGQPRQVIDLPVALALAAQPLAPGADLQALLAAEIARPFDLQRGPLLRVRLFAVAPDEHVLLLVQHHVISDAWSMQLMVEELVAGYRAACGHAQAPRPALQVQYADYAAWQRAWMDGGERARQLAYWRTQLGDEQPVLQLPYDHPLPAQPSLRNGRLELHLPPALAKALGTLARERGVTPFMLLLASYQLLLHRYSGQADIRVGVPNANRNHAQTEGLLGFFVNTQVLRAQLEPGQSFATLLEQVREAALQAQAHQDLPFEQLVEALQPERNLGHNPLFQALFNHQSAGSGNGLAGLPGLAVERLDLAAGSALFDLSLDTCEGPEGWSATFSYMAERFDSSTIARLAGHWLNLLQAVVTAPEQPLGNLAMLAGDELAQQCEVFNGPVGDYPMQRPVQQLFEDWAARTPQATAVVCAGQRLDYATLNQRANQLAAVLIARGVGPEVLVAIALERSPRMLVALLAVLKAGGAYLPLDPQYPAERLAYMLADSGARLLLSEAGVAEQLPSAGLDVLLLDQQVSEAVADNPPARVQPGNLAYIIYTSGSTGQPKGVAVAHGPLAMHVQAIAERYKMRPSDCELHFMSFAFDGAHERWLTCLTQGASLLVRDGGLWTPEQTYTQMKAHGVTVAAFPPAYLQQLAEHAEREGNPPAARVYCFGGDAVPQASFELARRALRPQYIINGYGPTETVVTPLIWKAGRDSDCGAAYAPIGERIGLRTAYVLDSELNLVPQGIAGELYLGGEGLARGYLGRPGLSAERFVADPFSQGGRLYRTGDLVRQRADGVVDYLGRVDNQVKIRGFRIELGEIEARLLAQPGVREAVVLARPGLSGQQLVAYVVPEHADTEPGALRDGLRQALREVLPDYMVPSAWQVLAQLPLTPAGKLDRKALPAPDATQAQGEYEAPQGELEQRLAGLWGEVLKLERVGRSDNFFELGGHSLLAMQVVARARELWQVDLPLKTLFSHPVLAEQALQLKALQGGQAPVQDALAKSLAALKRLSATDLEKLLSE